MLPQEQRAALQMTRQVRSDAAVAKASADVLVRAVLHAWQQAQFPALLNAKADRAPRYARQPVVVRMAAHLAQLPFFEATFWLSSAYAQWVGDVRRNEAAMFFTPPVLAERLLDDLAHAGANLVEATWADPACGGAAFLAPIAHRIAARLRTDGATARQVLQHLERRLRGNDADSALAEMSRQFLRMALYQEISASGYEPDWHVECGDALTTLESWRGAVDVVVCNPPYRKMPAAEVARYRARYGDVIDGQPNLYALFFRKALDLLSPAGLAGFITPTSFLSGQSFSKLRAHLLANAHTEQLSIVKEREGVFVGVQQEVAISVLRRQPTKPPRAASTRVFVYERDKQFIDIGVCQLPNSGQAWPVPRTALDVDALRLVGRSRYRLADYGYVPKIGWFVDYRDRHVFRPLLKAPAKPSSRKKYLPLVWSSDIAPNGVLQLNRLQEPKHKRLLELPRDHTTGIQRRPAVALQRVTSTDQPRRLVGAPIPLDLLADGIVGENHVIFLEQEDAGAQFTPEELAALLRSPSVDGYFRCISGSVNVSVFELQQLPLPNPIELRHRLDGGLPMDEAARQAFDVSKAQ